MTKRVIVAMSLLVLSLVGPTATAAGKIRLLIVSSYHREYLWSRDTQAGVCAGLIESGFLDSQQQATALTENDYVESSSAVIKKTWMDTKRKNSHGDIVATVNRVLDEIARFSPGLVLLGDDNAANYIGGQLVDTEIPVVFWGINGLPLKYGLLESLEKPGHNVTGVYQAGYLQECLAFLHKVVPEARTFAVLSDDSETGRSKAKELENLHRAGKLPLTLVESVVTNDLAEWKSRALKLAVRVDAFFMLNHNSLKNGAGEPVDQLEIGAWYLRNILKPECAQERQFAQEGMLCVCDDSGFNQGYEAVKLATRILKDGEAPGDIPVKAPQRGPLIVNRQRAEMLGIGVTEDAGTEQYVDTCLALERHPDIR